MPSSEFQEAKACFEQARAREVARIVGLLRPRHIQVIHEMAKRVQELSDLTQHERELRASVQGMLDQPVTELPDASAELGSLSDFHSPLAAWARRMRQQGALR